MLKLIKLKRICEDISGKIIHLYFTTDMPDGHISDSTVRIDTIYIMLSASQIKSLEMAIRAISHEMQHVLNNDRIHKIDFDERCAILEKKITKEYKK